MGLDNWRFRWVYEPMTETEEKVRRLMAQGMNSWAMATTLDISPDELRTHIERTLMKLNVHSPLGGSPPLPPAASMALAVPRLRSEDIPRHVGRLIPRRA